jgi:hypothetical protein
LIPRREKAGINPERGISRIGMKEEWEDVKQVVYETNLRSGGISACCGGYIWKYKEAI